MNCAVKWCIDPMDEFILVSLEIPAVRFEAVTLAGDGGLHKEVTLDNDIAVFEVHMCLRHGARIIKLREAGKRAVLPAATFGPLRESDGEATT